MTMSMMQMRKRGALIDIVYYLLIFYSKMEIKQIKRGILMENYE